MISDLCIIQTFLRARLVNVESYSYLGVNYNSRCSPTIRVTRRTSGRKTLPGSRGESALVGIETVGSSNPFTGESRLSAGVRGDRADDLETSSPGFKKKSKPTIPCTSAAVSVGARSSRVARWLPGRSRGSVNGFTNVEYPVNRMFPVNGLSHRFDVRRRSAVAAGIVNARREAKLVYYSRFVRRDRDPGERKSFGSWV